MRFNLKKYSFSGLVNQRIKASENKQDGIIRKIFKKITPSFIKNIIPNRANNPIRQKKIRFFIAIFQVIAIYIFTIFALFFLVKALTSASIKEPVTATDIIKKVDVPDSSFYVTQIHRQKRLDGVLRERDALMQVLVDTKRDKFQFVGKGIDPTTLKILSDGKTAVTIQGEGVPQQLTNVPPVSEATPIYAQDLLPMHPEVITDKATIAGEQGWKISFKPTKQVILQMFLADLLKLDDPDINLIRKGEFNVVYGSAYITRSHKEMIYLDVVITVDGAKYRLFTQYRLFNNDRMESYDLNDPVSASNKTL